jgi:hypothetical protein
VNDDELHATAERLLAALWPHKWHEAEQRRQIVSDHLTGLSEDDLIDIATRAISESLDINQAMFGAMRNHPEALKAGLTQFGKIRAAQRHQQTDNLFAQIVAGFDYE